MQRYFCRDCQKAFQNQHRLNEVDLYIDYVFHKQTVRELAKGNKKDRRTIKAALDRVHVPDKQHRPRPVHLLVDATYFGERTEDSSWCMVVFRNVYEKENLWWAFCDTETTSVYRQGRQVLESLGYTIVSATADGFGGIRQAFSGIPYQMCHVHMERIIRKGTTRNPQTEAGQTLRALILSLFDTDGDTFKRRYQQYLLLYTDFLNQKTINPETGRTEWTHARLRSAAMSLMQHLPYLFTFETDTNIPKDTNALEAHFKHINEVTAIHCGLSRVHKERLLATILLAGTIAPDDDEIKKLFEK